MTDQLAIAMESGEWDALRGFVGNPPRVIRPQGGTDGT